MPDNPEPIEGCWYESIEDNARFFVVTFDEDEGLVEIQHEDGRVEELAFETWQDADFSAIDPPDEDGLFGEAGEDEAEDGWRQGEEPEDGEWAEPLPEPDE